MKENGALCLGQGGTKRFAKYYQFSAKSFRETCPMKGCRPFFLLDLGPLAGGKGPNIGASGRGFSPADGLSFK